MGDADMGEQAYIYITLGSLFTRTDAKNKAVCMGYNQFNRLRSKSTGHSCQAPLNNYLFNQTEQFDYPTGMIDPCLISI